MTDGPSRRAAGLDDARASLGIERELPGEGLTFTIVIASWGDRFWRELAHERALPSAQTQGCEVLIGHSPEVSIGFRNEMASEASGDNLIFLDADDELEPGYVSAMREKARPGALLTPAVSYVRNGKREEPKFWPETNLTARNWLVIGTAIRSEMFFALGGFRDFPHGLEDWNLWARAVRAGASVVKVPGAVYVAHWKADSDHQRLLRDREAYREAYERARSDAWG